MRIGISELFARPVRAGGAESMLINLVKGLSNIKGVDDRIAVFNSFKRTPCAPGIEFLQIPRPLGFNRFMQETFILPWYSRDYDVMMFMNYFTPPVTLGARAVTLIHDLQQRHFPEYFSTKKLAWMKATQRFTMSRADSVVTLSTFCKQDLLEAYGSRYESKIHVIPNPISWDRYEPDGLTSGAQWKGLASPYVLSVAAQYPHKNMETLIRGFSRLLTRLPDYKLVLVGQLPGQLVGTSRSSQYSRLIRELHLQDKVLVTGFVSDQELGQWYRHAALFVFPSLFEGFGMPPVEALGLGVPVLSSRCGSLAEVTMGIPSYIENPLDANEYGEKMADMLSYRSRYAPSQEQINLIRDFYAPQRIAAMYYDVLSKDRAS